MNDTIRACLEHVRKPARYTGGEYNAVYKDKSQVDLRFAFCFPDIYEIGMSHLGSKILYGLLNSMEGVWCERAYAPFLDMEEQMRMRGQPLYALESGDPVGAFDILGFTLQYEMNYTGVLNMLDLAGVPLRSAQRTSLKPLVIAGGPCVYNAEPVADFFDLITIGEGEEVMPELLQLTARAVTTARARKNSCARPRRSAAFMCPRCTISPIMKTGPSPPSCQKTARLPWCVSAW